MKTKRKNIFKSLLALTLALIMVLGVAPINELAGVDWASLFAPKVEAAEKTYKVGDIIEFGSYPQSKVTDSSLVSALDSVSKNWVSYGYYSGDGSYGSMKPGNWMEYADFTYNGTKYRAVTFSQYRPWYTSYKPSFDCTYQDNNGYTPNDIYYFKYEPLKWRVLDPSTGLVLCESIIDSQAYSNTIYSYGNDPYYNQSAYWNDAEHTHYANDYATSSIRAWLNDDFYNTAFSSSQKASILTSELENKAYSISYSEYDSASTIDKVFLLSYSEAQNTSYGFTNNTYSTDIRGSMGTDYAKAQGLWIAHNKCSNWRLRSASNGSNGDRFVNDTGRIDVTNYVNDTCVGIRPAIKISNLAFGTFEPGGSEPGGDPEISKHFPNGYDFEKDSYGFKNYSDTISKKYFTTLYGAEKGKLLYNKYHKTGGLCFGMAYTTAAIYNGYPSCSQISTLDKGLFKYRYCEKIRDIWNLSVDFLDFTAHSTKIISSALPVGNNIISIEDYIKYAYIYQFSKTVSTTSTWCGDANLILDLVKQYTDEDKIGLTIGMTRKDGSGGHRVLVVGYEGNDILVDDSNRRSEYNRITVNSDGSWTFNGLDNYNSNFCYIRYNLDYQRPFELLQSGKTDTVTEKYIEGVETQETYIEGVDGLDKESMLLAVDSDSCDLDDKKFSAVYVETGDSISANTYWTDESTVSINNIIGGNHTIEFAGEGSIVSATVADSSNVVMTIDEDQLKAQVSGKKGDACTLSVDTCYINNSNKDVSKKIEIVGIVSESEAVVEQIDRGLRISGIESGTVALVVDDAVVSTEKITGEGDSFDIIYSKQEGDETLSIQKAGTPKKDSIFKKILNIILAPFRAIINLFKKLFGK